MLAIRSWLAVLVLLALIVLAPGFAGNSRADEAKGTGSSEPVGIDPLDPSAGDFLDVDLSELSKRATSLYQSGDYKEAAKCYLALLTHNVHDGASVYNLACCYGLLGEDALAAKYLERAVKAGFAGYDQARWDPDFAKVRGTKGAFDATLAKLDALAAEKEKGLGTVAYVSGRAFFKCRVQLPQGFDPKRTYPLVVGLHGFGASPENFSGIWAKFKDPQFIYVCPQAPYPMSGGGEIGYSWGLDGPPGENLGPRGNALAVRYVADVVSDMRARYSVGDVYLMGFSQGCGLTYVAGIKNYRMFKGLICFGGWLDTDALTPDDIAAAKGLRVFIAHGTKDTMVEYKAGEAARDALIKAGYDVTFFSFDGPHRVPPEAVAAAQEWMAKP